MHDRSFSTPYGLELHCPHTSSNCCSASMILLGRDGLPAARGAATRSCQSCVFSVWLVWRKCRGAGGLTRRCASHGHQHIVCIQCGSVTHTRVCSSIYIAAGRGLCTSQFHFEASKLKKNTGQKTIIEIMNRCMPLLSSQMYTSTVDWRYRCRPHESTTIEGGGAAFTGPGGGGRQAPLNLLPCRQQPGLLQSWSHSWRGRLRSGRQVSLHLLLPGRQRPAAAVTEGKAASVGQAGTPTAYIRRRP